jgi:hypothetical protein
VAVIHHYQKVVLVQDACEAFQVRDRLTLFLGEVHHITDLLTCLETEADHLAVGEAEPHNSAILVELAARNRSIIVLVRDLSLIDFLHSALVQDVLVLMGHKYEESTLDTTLAATLVQKDLFNFQSAFTRSDEFWRLFLVVVKIPEPYHFVISHEQLVVFVVQYHGMGGLCLELEK